MQTAAQQLGQLPAHEGFRMRGLQMTRIETFTDADFTLGLNAAQTTLGAIAKLAGIRIE